jgi:hypothetical protein
VTDGDRVRLELAFEGGQALTVVVAASIADDLDRALSEGSDGAFSFDAEDGRYTVGLRKVVFVKRFARESRVGFGASA